MQRLVYLGNRETFAAVLSKERKREIRKNKCLKTNQGSEPYVPKIRDAEQEYAWMVLEGFQSNSLYI